MLDVERMPQRIGIGRETETGVTDVEIDVSAWVSKWPGMALHAIHTPEGGAPYILQTETDGSVLVWHVTDADTATPGTGLVEIVGETDGRRKVSATVKVSVAARMSGTVGEPPEAAKPWADRVVEAAERITGMKAQAKTLDAGSGATAAWDGEQGLLTIGVPKGKDGADGKDAVVDATLTQSGQAADAKATGDALAYKLSEPADGLAVGKYFRVAALDENGHAVLEAVDAKTVGVQDVQIDGETIVTDGVANVSKYDTVKDAMCDGKGAAWTADEQAAARERMGVPGGYELIEEITLEEVVDNILRYNEPDGTTYNLVNALVSVYVPIQDGGYVPGTIWVYFQNYNNFNAGRLYVSDSRNISKNVYLRAEQRTSNGVWLSPRGEFGQENLASTKMNVYNVKTGNSNIFRIHILATLPAGTIIQIYGVRA